MEEKKLILVFFRHCIFEWIKNESMDEWVDGIEAPFYFIYFKYILFFFPGVEDLLTRGFFCACSLQGGRQVYLTFLYLKFIYINA